MWLQREIRIIPAIRSLERVMFFTKRTRRRFFIVLNGVGEVMIRESAAVWAALARFVFARWNLVYNPMMADPSRLTTMRSAVHAAASGN